MAVVYLRSSDGNDADSGATWALAKATLASALTAAGAGGTVYMSSSHSESGTGATLTSPGTAAAPVLVLSVDDTGDPEPPTAMAAGGKVAITGNGNTMDFSGFAHVHGVIFELTSGNNVKFNFTSSSAWYWHVVDGAFEIDSTHTGAGMQVGAISGAVDGQWLILENTDIHFGNVSQTITISAALHWHGGSLNAGTAVPTTLFTPTSTRASVFAHIHGVDLSQAGSGKNLINVSGAVYADFSFETCKLGSSVSITTGTINSQGAVRTRLTNCDSADTNYRYERMTYQGSIYQETTIVRSGGASDGTTSMSREMVTNANAKLVDPLVSDPIIIWNETIGSSVTVTIETVTDNVTLTDKEAWVEVEYLGTSGFPLASVADDRASDDNAYLGSGTNQTSSSATWTTTGLTTPVKQKLEATFTPQEKGPFQIRVVLAKASTTMYFCPKPAVA